MEFEDWEDASSDASSSSSLPPRSPSPLRSVSYPTNIHHGLSTDAKRSEKKKEKKEKKRRFLFHRRKKRSKSSAAALYPVDDDDSLKDLAILLVDPSVLRKGSLDPPPITRAISDSAVRVAMGVVLYSETCL